MRIALILAALLLAVPSAGAQDETIPAPEPRLSPLQLAKVQLGETYVKIHYSSPQRRHPETGETREVFGALVPFGEVWRTGANEATEITFSDDVMFGGSHVTAGTYSVYTVPREDGWTVILNGVVGEWGAFSYDDTRDVLRVEAAVEHGVPTHEAFTIEFEETASGADMLFTWETTRARVPIMAH